jgi:hypothetical protein
MSWSQFPTPDGLELTGNRRSPKLSKLHVERGFEKGWSRRAPWIDGEF